MIEVNSIQFAYRGSKSPALDCVSFQAQAGSVFTLLGPNGAGKTTLVRILAGLILPISGNARVCGHDVVSDATAARASIGLALGEERSFYYRLSGAQNLEFFGGLAGLHRKVLRHRVHEVMQLLGLESEMKLPYMKYSTGMRKRLGIARALLANPPVYLLDEPNSGVDPASASQIRSVIRNLRAQGCTILMTTHYMEEAERLSDTIGFLKSGRLAKIGDLSSFKRLITRRALVVDFADDGQTEESALQTVKGRLAEQFRAVMLRSSGKKLEISFNGQTDVNRMLHVLSQAEIPIKGIALMEPSLEDVFLRLAEDPNV
jgi:ABC-2 type transport system ATP-binding protein